MALKAPPPGALRDHATLPELELRVARLEDEVDGLRFELKALRSGRVESGGVSIRGGGMDQTRPDQGG